MKAIQKKIILNLHVKHRNPHMLPFRRFVSPNSLVCSLVVVASPLFPAPTTSIRCEAPK